MSRGTGAMIGGGSLTAISANSDKINMGANSDFVYQAVNLLHAPMIQFESFFIAPNTIFSFIGCSLGLYGLYKSIKDKK